MDHDNEHPGTLSANEWLSELKQFQRYAGRGALPARNVREGRPLRQWVERMRRMARAGHLPLSLAISLARQGIRLVQDNEKGEATTGQAEAAFQKNMARLKDWIAADCRTNRRKAAQITYAGSRADKAVRQNYTFLEHMRLKMRQDLLPSDHYWDLINLPLVINGGSVSQWLNVTPSMRQDALGKEIDIEQYLPLRESRVDVELAARNGERGEVYIAGTGTLSVVVSEGRLETLEGLAVHVTEWRREDGQGWGTPTLVYLADLDTHGVLSFYQVGPREKAAPSLRAQYTARAYANYSGH